MHIGFTGTQEGMTPRQKDKLYDKLDHYYSKTDLNILHHGDCFGADEEAHRIAWDMCFDMIVHPPEKATKRAYCLDALIIHDPKPYLDRNHDIVDACDVLIAAPKTSQEEQRSGTWATVRYARRTNKPVIILEP